MVLKAGAGHIITPRSMAYCRDVAMRQVETDGEFASFALCRELVAVRRVIYHPVGARGALQDLAVSQPSGVFSQQLAARPSVSSGIGSGL